MGAFTLIVSLPFTLTCFTFCWLRRQASQSHKAFSTALFLMEDAERAGVEVDAATVDAVLAALGKV